MDDVVEFDAHRPHVVLITRAEPAVSQGYPALSRGPRACTLNRALAQLFGLCRRRIVAPSARGFTRGARQAASTLAPAGASLSAAASTGTALSTTSAGALLMFISDYSRDETAQVRSSRRSAGPVARPTGAS